MMKAGVVSRTDVPEALKETKRIIDSLKEKGFEVSVETDTALALGYRNSNTDLSNLNGDFIVTVGGDGTILRTAMGMNDPGTPLLGVNMGRRGFLSEVSVKEFDSAVDRLQSGDYKVEECMKLSSMSPTSDESFPAALNEVLVASRMPSKMVLVRMCVDDVHVADIQADGIIVSTPAGSTEYNMSAGGSIVSPDLDVISITAICPYSYFKSLVVPRGSRVTLELLKPKAEAMVIVDGRSYHPLNPMSVVECWASQDVTRFIRFSSFYSRIQKRIINLQTQ